MDLFQILWDSFLLDERPIEDLIKISSLIDSKKSQTGSLTEPSSELSLIASTIVALMNEINTFSVGEKLYSSISNLIVEKNFALADTKQGKNLYQKLLSKNQPGTYRVRMTRAGYKFDLAAANGEILATSEVYSKLTSCISGIESVKKHVTASVEDQTEDNYKIIRNPKYEVYMDRAGEYRFRLKASNGAVICTSCGYKKKESCYAAIESTKTAAISDFIEKF